MPASLPYINVQQTFRRLLKWLGLLALGCYVLVAIAFIGMRYWLLPNIDHWREPLQRELSAMLSMQLQLGEVTAEWGGRHPRIVLRDASLYDADGQLLLAIPSLDAVVAWPSLIVGKPRFLGLRADGVALSVQRDRDDRLSVLGRHVTNGNNKVEASGNEPSDVDLLQWLARQDNVQFSNASIHWLDASRGAVPLELRNVFLVFGRDGNQHVFSMQARPPPSLGESFALQGELRVRLEEGPLKLDGLSGRFHVNVEGMQPANWSPWFDVYTLLEAGEVSWLGWQDVVDGQLGRHVSKVTIEQGVWRPQQGLGVQAASASLYIAGPWSALHALWSAPDARGQLSRAVETSKPSQAVRVALRMRGLGIEAPEDFDAPLVFNDLALSAELARDTVAGLQVQADRLQLRNPDMDLDLAGSWQAGSGDAGRVDVQGRFLRAELAAIVRYLPYWVDEDARHWMQRGLLAGRLTDAALRLKGDLSHFPFGDQPESGDFYVGGTVQGAIIDYAPADAVGPPGWPRLEELNGHAQLHRVDLKISADSMQMRPGGQRIGLEKVQAHIPNIEQNSVLEIRGTGQADATAFLSLIRTSPLSQLLDGLFEDARARGHWKVPIALTIPLYDTDATQVQGEVVFKNGSLQFSDGIPPLSSLNGSLQFTDEAMSVAGLKAQLLGGPVVVTGGVGKGQQGLDFNGRMSAEALTSFLQDEFSKSLQGSTPYLLKVQRDETGSYGVRVEASMEGIVIDLPAPMAKRAGEKLPLHAQWKPAKGRADAVFDLHLGKHFKAQFLLRDKRDSNTGFHAGAINLRGKAKPPDHGLAIDVQAPNMDIDAWRDLFDRLETLATTTGHAAVLPPLRDLRLQADTARVFGMNLDRLTFTARRPEGERWRVDISSTQTAGTLFWREAQGRIQGEVEAQFERLALGVTGEGKADGQQAAGNGSDKAAPAHLDEKIDFPAIRLKVGRLRLYGREVGALSLVGVNESRGRLWKLEQLELASPHASLKGSGVWRLDGPQRGLTIQAVALFDDLGAYLEQAGFKDLMRDGHGQVQGSVEWRDIPWRFDRAALYGDVNVELFKGRFLSVGSRSARLLEMLSLQSVKRLATLDWNPTSFMQQGFPFDELRGNLKLHAGVLHSENYRVVGPVGTIMIAGDVDLPKEKLDLQAVVVPNLDVSGAAIAAGIAVNPIVGIGAFLTQWLLKNPLGKAMSVEYRVKGDFDEPQVKEINTPSGKH